MAVANGYKSEANLSTAVTTETTMGRTRQWRRSPEDEVGDFGMLEPKEGGVNISAFHRRCFGAKKNESLQFSLSHDEFLTFKFDLES